MLTALILTVAGFSWKPFLISLKRSPRASSDDDFRSTSTGCKEIFLIYRLVRMLYYGTLKYAQAGIHFQILISLVVNVKLKLKTVQHFTIIEGGQNCLSAVVVN